MRVVAVASMKGGVGKTSTTANLAHAVAKLGRPVLAVDLDPQNSLLLHLGLPGSHVDGMVSQALEGRAWQDGLCLSPSGVLCLPYGRVSAAGVAEFERQLGDAPEHLLTTMRAVCAHEPDAIVLIDTPPGPSPYLKAAFVCADLAVLILLADGGSYATIPAMETWLQQWSLHHPELRTGYVLNQTDPMAPLSRDVAEVLRQRLGQRLVPVGIHRDEAVGEALAVQQSVIDYDPHCQAAHDFRQLASWLLRHLS